MFNKLALIIIGIGALAAAGPVMAADLPDASAGRLATKTDGSPSPGAWDHAYPDKAPLSDRQLQTDRVDRMAKRLGKNEADDLPGEGGLGTGTSITH